VQVQAARYCGPPWATGIFEAVLRSGAAQRRLTLCRSLVRATLATAGSEERLANDGAISDTAVSALLVAFAAYVVARYLAAQV
jgi:hypothetical protein